MTVYLSHDLTAGRLTSAAWGHVNCLLLHTPFTVHAGRHHVDDHKLHKSPTYGLMMACARFCMCAARPSVIINMSHMLFDVQPGRNPTAVSYSHLEFLLSLHSLCSLFAALMAPTPPPVIAPSRWSTWRTRTRSWRPSWRSWRSTRSTAARSTTSSSSWRTRWRSRSRTWSATRRSCRPSWAGNSKRWRTPGKGLWLFSAAVFYLLWSLLIALNLHKLARGRNWSIDNRIWNQIFLSLFQLWGWAAKESRAGKWLYSEQKGTVNIFECLWDHFGTFLKCLNSSNSPQKVSLLEYRQLKRPGV